VEIAIKQCRNGGIDCKVHGLQIVGKKKTDEDLFSNNMSFLASDSEECDEQGSSTGGRSRFDILQQFLKIINYLLI
jgi:E3 ubiquitin-protein ligase HERC2